MEEQMSGREETGPAKADVTQRGDASRRSAEQERTQRERRRQALELQRQNILGQRTANAGRRAALEAALEVIERELAELN